MAVDKLVDSTQLDSDLTSVANAIRTKGGTSASLTFPSGFVSAIEAISGGGGTTWETIYEGNVSVTNAESSYYYGSVSSFYDDILLNSVWRVTWNGVQYECTATYTDSDFDNYALGDPSITGGTASGNNEPFILGRMWGSVLVVFARQSGTVSLKLEKQVSSSVNLQAKTNIDPTESSQTIEPDSGYDGLSSVQINAVSSSYVGSGVARKSSSDLTASTLTVTAPAGYYESAATKTLTDENLVATNIKNGVSIFGVTGSYQGGGSGGLVYETGTYTPSSDVAQPTISFANSHTNPPIFVVMSDTSSPNSLTSSSNVNFNIVDNYRINGAGYPYNTSSYRYGLVGYAYRSSNSTTTSNVQIQYNSDDTGSGSSYYYRYWATPSNFKPGSNSTSRYWRSGRTYKWMAVWGPTT